MITYTYFKKVCNFMNTVEQVLIARNYYSELILTDSQYGGMGFNCVT